MLGHECLVDSSMPPGMEGIHVSVFTHLIQSVIEPKLIRFTENRAKLLVEAPGLKEWDVSVDVLVPNDVPERGDGAYGAKNGNMIIPSQRNFLLSFSVLYGFGETEVNDDALNALVVQVLDVTPAHKTFRIDLRECSRDEA